jgi:hypothetical protein
MKRFFLFPLFLILLFSSCQKITHDPMTVERDCIGTYLRYNQKDYHVCNPEKLNGLQDGLAVKATYKKIDDCDASKTWVVCDMIHENKGWIEILKVEY